MESAATPRANNSFEHTLDVPSAGAGDEGPPAKGRRRSRNWTERLRSTVLWYVLALITAGVFDVHVTTNAPSTGGITWKLVEADDFNGSSLDTSKWGLLQSWDQRQRDLFAGEYRRDQWRAAD